MLQFFIDPVLRAPTLGCMLMCLASGLIGCLAFLQKRSLVGEALSHAAYPGVVLSVLIATFYLPFSEKGVSAVILLGAFVSGLLGQWVIDRLQAKLQINSDAALCFVLSVFFGVGVLVASHLQLSHALWHQQIQVFLFGQAATMVDGHVILYGILAIGITLVLVCLLRYLEILYFDPDFAQAVGVPIVIVNGAVHFLLVVAIVVGMRSVGVVLMSAMLVAPAAAARQWTQKLSTFLGLAALMGSCCGFLGNAFSIWIPQWVGQPKLSLPTGPMIVLIASSFCLLSLCFAPKRGCITRGIRLMRFRIRCRQENLLKVLYKGNEHRAKKWQLRLMQRKKWLDGAQLTALGKREAERLIRLHRLWEAYLVHMGQGVERVHHSAEEMEHILTTETEAELQALLDHPKLDPHAQPIPQEELL